MSTPQPQQENVDCLARELFDRYHPCPICHTAVSLAEQLAGRCPHCEARILAGPDITPTRARQMLATLKARRVALGLSVNP